MCQIGNCSGPDQESPWIRKEGIDTIFDEVINDFLRKYDKLPSFLKNENKRIYSENDPYGEENWEE